MVPIAISHRADIAAAASTVRNAGELAIRRARRAAWAVVCVLVFAAVLWQVGYAHTLGVPASVVPPGGVAQMTALGLRDVFADAPQRVFEATLEEVISRDPDMLVILSYSDTPQEAEATFLRIPGAANLKAVRGGAILVQPYEYSSQGPLSVTGLENMARYLASVRP